jgi:Tfp pilus assembly protein PilX
MLGAHQPAPAAARPVDRGSAIIITLMVISLLAALAATVTGVAINNVQSSRLAGEAGVAVNAADAGIAEATSFLRTNGVRALCVPPTAYDATAPTFNKAFDLATRSCVDSPGNGTKVQGKPYTVLIVTVAAYGTSDVGRYLIYSTGVGAGAASRTVTAELEVKGLGVPKGGFFGHAVFGAGQVYVNQSIFSTGCVYVRSHIAMSGMDSYGLPSAVHSSQVVTDDNGSTTNCAVSNKAVHKAGPCYYPGPDGLNGAFDQDVLGGSLGGTSCLSARSQYPSVSAATWSRYYPNGSQIADSQTLLGLYGIKDPALTQDEIDGLRAVAKAQDNYRTTASSSDSYTPNGTRAVVFYDLTGGKVDLGTIKGFSPPGNGTCPDRSLVVVISGADAVFPSGSPLAASVFVTTPGKMYSSTGGKLVGTATADLISLGGNAVVDPADQQCYTQNPSPSLLTMNLTAYREIDG